MTSSNIGRYLSVEKPDAKATIDFLSESVVVTIEVEDGKIRVFVQAQHKDDNSYFNILLDEQVEIPDLGEEGEEPRE